MWPRERWGERDGGGEQHDDGAEQADAFARGGGGHAAADEAPGKSASEEGAGVAADGNPAGVMGDIGGGEVVHFFEIARNPVGPEAVDGHAEEVGSHEGPEAGIAEKLPGGAGVFVWNVVEQWRRD